MLLKLDFAQDTPIYLQIRNQIVLGIANGELKPGEKLPPIRTLAAETGVNTMTVNKAYQMLKAEGYIYTDRRNGAKVREHMGFSHDLPEESKELLQRVVSEAKVRGISKEEFFELCETYFE